jgi:hypothetical protein
MAAMEYLGAWGTLIHEKNLKSKISCQTPFKDDMSYLDRVGDDQTKYVLVVLVC